MRQIGETKRGYWRCVDSFDRDWDIPRIGISISIVDDPQSGRILTGLGFPKTRHAQPALTRMRNLEEYRNASRKIQQWLGIR